MTCMQPPPHRRRPGYGATGIEGLCGKRTIVLSTTGTASGTTGNDVVWPSSMDLTAGAVFTGPVVTDNPEQVTCEGCQEVLAQQVEQALAEDDDDSLATSADLDRLAANVGLLRHRGRQHFETDAELRARVMSVLGGK